MKKLSKKIVAMICALTMVAGTVLVYDVGPKMDTVEASTSTATNRGITWVEQDYSELSISGGDAPAVPIEGPEGYLFAGWYADPTWGGVDECESFIPLGTDNSEIYGLIDEYIYSTYLYAKYVDENVLSTKAQIVEDTIATTDTVDIRFVTTVDSKNYSQVGFEVTIKGKTRYSQYNTTVYKQLTYVGASNEILTYGPKDEFSNVSEYFKTYTVRGVPNAAFGTNITVRAYWVTLDGTKVYGTQAVKNINKGIFEKDEIDSNMLFNCDTRDFYQQDIINNSEWSGHVTNKNRVDVVSDVNEEKTEGKGAIKTINNDSYLVLQTILSQPVNISNAVSVDETYLKFDLYVEDGSVFPNAPLKVSIGSGTTFDSNVLTLKNSGELQSGRWNEVSICFNEMAAGGYDVDWANISRFRIFFDPGQSYLYTMLIDNVRVERTDGQKATIMDCDDVNGITFENAGTGSYDCTAKAIEGASSLGVTVQQTKILGNNLMYWFERENGIDLSGCDKISMWIYVNSLTYVNAASWQIHVGSVAGDIGTDSYSWTKPVNAGWNEIILDFADGTPAEHGTYKKLDPSNVEFMRINLSGTPNVECCTQGLEVRLDGIRGIKKSELVDCETVGNVEYTTGQISFTNDEYKQGLGAVKCTNATNVWYRFYNADGWDLETYETGRLNFKLYINDVNYLEGNAVNVHIGSGTVDSEDCSKKWNISPTELKSGWNDISLPIATAPAGDNNIDITSVKLLRIYQDSSNANLETIIDDIHVSENGPQLVKTTYDTNDAVVADVIPQEMGFKVKGDGETDCTGGLQAALDYCSENGGGTVYLPAGTYLITSPIRVPAWVTLRGDWNDPDSENFDYSNYGTVILVDGPAANYAVDEQTIEHSTGDVAGTTPSGVINLGGAGGVVGLTVFYHDITTTTLQGYPHTFYVNGLRENAMYTTVRNVTVINGEKGIGATVTPNEGTSYETANHESLQVENFKGTFLEVGIEAYRSTDTGEMKNITIDPKYWANNQFYGNKLDVSVYTSQNATGMRIGDVEWTNYTNIYINNYQTGFHIDGPRRASDTEQKFAGALYNAQITNAQIGLKIESLDTRWGMVVANSTIQGSDYSIYKTVGGVVNYSKLDTKGAELYGSSISNMSDNFGEHTKGYEEILQSTDSYTKPSNNFVVVNLKKYIEEVNYDASLKIQESLDYMEKLGGGVVYVPGGLYRLHSPLDIPKGVELRGSSSVATRDITARMTTEANDQVEGWNRYGTVFFSYYGTEGCLYEDKGIVTNETDAVAKRALITLKGDGAGLNGVRIWYPENSHTRGATGVWTAYAVKGEAPNVYITNCMIARAALGVFLNEKCDNHYVDGLVTGCYHNAIRVTGQADDKVQNGTIANVLQNGTVMARTVLPIEDAVDEEKTSLENVIFSPITKPNHQFIIVEHAASQRLYDNFAYGVFNGIVNQYASDTKVYGFGIDQIQGTYIYMNGGSLAGVNLLRCALSNSTYYTNISGELYLYNSLLLSSGSVPDVSESK